MAAPIKLFGFTIQRDGKEEAGEQPVINSVVSPALDDGAVNITSGAHYGIYVDLDGSYRSEVDLLSKYRTMAMQPEMENAIDDIVNEAIVHDERGKCVQIELDELDQPDNIKTMIRDEFENVLKLLDFHRYGADIFRRWYVDGRAYWNVTINPDNPRDGIQQLTFIDPRRIRKIRNITKEKNDEGVDVIKKIEVFYLYNEKIVNNNVQTPQIIGNFSGGVKLSEDSVIHLTSGLFDPAKSVVLSYLHKAIRPMNQLRFIEDATVIYKVTRAPERRVFYCDTGNLPRAKAEAYMKDLMTKFRNKLTYDASTGQVMDDRKHLSMLEDFWMPRRSGDKSTEITTLPAGQGFDNMDSVLYFEKKLYRALQVPVSRMESNQGFSLGKTDTITRDEIKFNKFIQKLRNRFSNLFDELLMRQLTLKGVCTLEEWDQFKQDCHYKFVMDNNFTELKEAELITNRVNTLILLTPYVGEYFSKRWVQENILQLDEDEIKKMEKEIKSEQDKLAKDAEDAADGAPPNPNVPGPGNPPAKPAQPAGAAEPQPTANPQELNKRVDNLLQ
jgi:Bacteriophage T4-like portal protein (Gp20)